MRDCIIDAIVKRSFYWKIERKENNFLPIIYGRWGALLQTLTNAMEHRILILRVNMAIIPVTMATKALETKTKRSRFSLFEMVPNIHFLIRFSSSSKKPNETFLSIFTKVKMSHSLFVL